MRSLSPRKRHATLFLLIGMWLGYVTPSYADSGNFAGIYHLQNVVDGGDQVSATFVMQTFNNSTADVADATIKLVEGPFLPVVTDMTYEALAIPGGSNAVIQGDITIPKDLYNQWLDGLMPYALIQYVDASGARLQYPIEVTGGGL